MERVLTVGLDGSPESLAAAHWAADEAERRRLTLRLLHAWPLLVPEPTHVPAEMDQNYWAKRLVHNAQTELQAGHPGLTVVGNLVADDAQDALLHAASESEMLVLGSRGLTPVESYFLGDISMIVVARAERPVVLVRADKRAERPSTPESGAAGGVVVGLELRAPCDDLLEFAFTTAAARNVPLRAIHGLSTPLHAYTPWGVDHTVTREIIQDAQKHLSQALRPWREKFPGVDVADTTRLESPARAVVGAAEGADLLVVGRRKHHPNLGPRLGPVAQAAVHHARCPVAVVPHD
ncbi:universal stress protein [Streptomyces umbrinus]|uniref:universal stress protein n=1 Tax=Streptomyces umbrinus TaxID=67370 RepID=UPI00167B7EE0|nr:universal stress protein [Streptomyces umbrinus]GHB31481.1 stress-inducible protein [Streptomyces umbrinus]